MESIPGYDAWKLMSDMDENPPEEPIDREEDIAQAEAETLAMAAPDLLRACEAISDFYLMDTEAFVAKYGHGVTTKAIGEMARAAVQKAKGG